MLVLKIQIKPKVYPLSNNPLSHGRYSLDSPLACQVKCWLKIKLLNVQFEVLVKLFADQTIFLDLTVNAKEL